MTFRIIEAGRTLDVEHIASLENELGKRLPEQYRRFLFANNGGIPQPNVVIDIEGLVGSPTDVQEFFGIGLAINSSNIVWYMREVPERLPPESIPIACDSGGNLFCLLLSGEHVGRVVYVDFEGDEPIHHYVADSFDAFLAKIR